MSRAVSAAGQPESPRTADRGRATVDWELMIDEQALAGVIPGEFARFARPIREALVVFLRGLPSPHQAAILAHQAALPVTASFSERLAQLARCCPVLHKLGQVLARDQRLSPDLRAHLRELESLRPTVPLDAIQRVLRQEFGPLELRGLTLLPPPLAEASVAVVIGFQPAKSHRGIPSEGVFKILKPGIEERLELELELLERVGTYLDQRCDELQIPPLDYAESFQQVKEKLRYEIRLDEEQRHLARARRLYAAEPRVLIPAVFRHCTPRVTAMERVRGVKLPDHELVDRGARRRLAELVVQSLIVRPILARDAQTLFHGDPHAGNLLLTEDGRLAILDWSLAGTLGERQRIAVVQIMLGVLTLDRRRVAELLAGLAERRQVDRSSLEDVVEAWLRRVRRGEFPGLVWLTGLLDDAVHRAGLRVSGDLMLFRKSLHTLEGVVADLRADGFGADQVIVADFLRQFAVEWPCRWLVPPDSREFATRLSNFDLMRTIVHGPTAFLRFWTGHTRDLLGGVP